MSEILVNTIKKADGTGGLTVPSGSGTVATLAGGTFTGDITMSSADLVVGSNSIFIGGTGSANELSDYEEGTWTPAIDDDQGFSYGGFSNVNATYTKIGNVVVVRASFNFTSTEDVVVGDRFQMSGLPFTPAETSDPPYIHSGGTLVVYRSYSSGQFSTGVMTFRSNADSVWGIIMNDLGGVEWEDNIAINAIYYV